MKTRMTAALITLALIGMAAPASAYHFPIKDHPGWVAPGNGQLVLCEDPDLLTPSVGGLCFMSTQKNLTSPGGSKDCTSSPSPDTWCKGGQAYDNDDVKKNNTWSKVRANYITPPCNGFYRVGQNAHGLQVATDGWFFYKELLADWISGGHVTFFPNGGECGVGLVDPAYDAMFNVADQAGSGPPFKGDADGNKIPDDCEGTDEPNPQHNGPGGTGTFKTTTVCTDNEDVSGDPVTNVLFGLLDLVDCLLAAPFEPSPVDAVLDCLDEFL